MDTNEFSFRDYIDLRINPVYEELGRIRAAIEKMSVSNVEFEHVRAEVKKISVCTEEIENRIIKLEQANNVSVWLFRVVAGVGTAILISWLTGLIN